MSLVSTALNASRSITLSSMLERVAERSDAGVLVRGGEEGFLPELNQQWYDTNIDSIPVEGASIPADSVAALSAG